MAYSDTFGGASLGPNWSFVGQTFITSGGLATPGAGYAQDSNAYYSAGTFTNDQYSEAVFGADATGGGVGAGFGVCVRNDGTNVYRFVGNVSGYELAIFNPSYSLITSGSGTTFAAGDTIRLEISSSTLRMYKNGVQFGSDQTNSALASGKAGIMYSGDSTDGSLTSWAGGDLGGAVATLMGQAVF